MNLSRSVFVGAVALVTAATMVVSSPSQAIAAPDPSTHYPAITLGDPATSATATFPGASNLTATITTGEDMNLVGGASTFLPSTRGMGLIYGSSQNFPYLSIKVDNTTTTTATITLSREPAATRFAFALGDIDAETLVITMENAANTALTAAQMGAQTPFNHASASGPVPTVTENGNEITVDDPNCPPNPPPDTACDTNGATAWFQPTVPVKTITITSSTKTGFPRYQLWMAYTDSQVVSWTPAVTSFDVADSPFTPDQLATVSFPSAGGSTIAYAVDAASTSDCTVDSTTAEITASTTGSCVVVASAASTSDFAAGSTSVTFTITTPPPPAPEPTKPPTPTEWSPETTTFQVDSFPGVINLPPPPNPPGGGSYTFSAHGDSTSLCTIDRDTPTITVQQPGTCIVTANIGATKNFSKASVTVAFTIASGPMLAATGAPAWPVWPAVAGLVGVAILVASRVLYSPRHRGTSA